MGVPNWQVWSGAGAVVVALFVVGGIFGGQDAAPAMAADDTYYRVTSGNAGEYMTVGPRSGERCLWNRADQPSRALDDIAEAGEAKPGRNTTVELREGEYFISWGCYPWRQQ